MIVNYRKHSKKIKTTAIVMLIVTGFIFFTFTGFAKEEQSNRLATPREINRPTPYTIRKDDPNIFIRVTKEGEIWIENQQFDIGSIGPRMERFKKEYPKGNVVIVGNVEAPLGIAIAVHDEAKKIGIENVYISMAKD